jgi:hypothetical protein
MGFDHGFRRVRQGLDGFLSGISAHISGDGDERDSQQDRQAGALQIVASCNERKHKQTAADDIADDRKMVQQKMDVC